MLETLRDLRRVGYIRTPATLGWDLHYAQAVSGEERGRRIMIATDRPIDFWEAVNRPRTDNRLSVYIHRAPAESRR